MQTIAAPFDHTNTRHELAFQPWMLLDLDEPDPAAEVGLDVDTVLWLGALQLAGGASFDPFPDSLEPLARRYFALFPPVTAA